jgi:transcription-repair coupling factor (superfamily II helicase)
MVPKMTAESKNRTLYGVPEGQDARILAQKARTIMPEDCVLVHVAMDGNRLANLQEQLAFFAPDVRVICLPAWDSLPYDRVSPHADIVAARVTALTGLIRWQKEKERYPRILLVSLNAAVQRVMPVESLLQASVQARAGQKLDLTKFQNFLAQNGYLRTETVRETGEFAVRGGIIDLYPAGYENPLRIDLFGDEIESIRMFDPATQMTVPDRAVKECSLLPATEFFLDEESIARFRAAYREMFGAAASNDPLYEAVSAGRRMSGIEHWLPLFHQKLETVFDYAPNAEMTFDPHIREAYEERMLQIRDFYQSRYTVQKNTAKRSGSATGQISAPYHPVPVTALYIRKQNGTSGPKRALNFQPSVLLTNGK